MQYFESIYLLKTGFSMIKDMTCLGKGLGAGLDEVLLLRSFPKYRRLLATRQTNKNNLE